MDWASSTIIYPSILEESIAVFGDIDSVKISVRNENYVETWGIEDVTK
ncbi:hypothetical protein G3A_02310 [Bacillus sp. 17376]|nr:hypothetical protein [Mesobacillus boroniphilus]ESU34210.1 hypothetical protein G3A_02310 [Bacillus sp. 17376]